jgi:hypothetical protein
MLYQSDLVTEFGTEGHKRAEEEFTLQKAVCQYLSMALPRSAFYFAIPNGGLRHTRVAQKLAATGCKAGVPDLQVCFQGKAHFIELKAPKGALSAVQKQVHNRLDLAGCPTAVCRSIADVEQALKGWGIVLSAKIT